MQAAASAASAVELQRADDDDVFADLPAVSLQLHLLDQLHDELHEDVLHGER